MKISAIPAKDLSTNQIERWEHFHLTNPVFSNPYFHPQFTCFVAEVRNDAYVSILEENNQIIGFFPFHRKRLKTGRPIGLGLSDYQAVITEKTLSGIDAKTLIKDSGLVRWEFDHSIADQAFFMDFQDSLGQSPIIDVSKGYDFYKGGLGKSGRKQLKEAKRKAEKLGKDIGELRFTAHSADKEILSQLIDWKSQQCRQTGTVDYFALQWCRDLVDKIHSTRRNDFGGILSTLHAGDTLAAVHFAMYSTNVWHSWFPAYNNELSQYSPGSILLYQMIEAAANQKIQYIDLGKGISTYKKRVMTGAISVAEGCVQIPSIINNGISLGTNIENWARTSFLKPALRFPGNIIKSWGRQNRYD